MYNLFEEINETLKNKLNIHKPILYPAVGEFNSDSLLNIGERLASRAAFLFDEDINLHNVYWQQRSIALSYNPSKLSDLIVKDQSRMLDRCLENETYTLINQITSDYLSKQQFETLQSEFEQQTLNDFGIMGATVERAEYLKAESLLLLTKPKQTSFICYVELKLNGTDTKYQMIYLINSNISFETETQFNMLAYPIYNKLNGRQVNAYESDILQYISGNTIRYKVRAENDAKEYLNNLKIKAKEYMVNKILELGQYIKADYTDKINDLYSDIERMERDIRDAYRLILEYQAIEKSEWLGQSESATKELHKYLIDNPHLQDHLIKIDYDRDVVQRKVLLHLSIKAPMTFDGELYNRYRNKNNDNAISLLKDSHNQLMQDLIEDKIKIYFSGKATIDLTTGKLDVRGVTNDTLYRGCINNTHWKAASCSGTLKQPVKNAVQNKHYIPMLHLLIQGVSGLNMDDLTITKRFIRDLEYGKLNDAEIHKQDGTVVTLKEYIDDIQEQEVPF